MEVTKKNFLDVLPEVAGAIDKADFLAVDTEFSGIDAFSCNPTSPLDTPEERYHKIRQGSCDFLVFQFGLCTFCYDNENNRYEARPYNFYIFPRPYSRAAPDCRFLCQASSIDFLVSQNFDFNKVFKEGISYLNPDQESRLRESLEEKHKQYNQFSSPAFFTPDGGAEAASSKGPVDIPEEQKEFIEGICKSVAEFLENSDSETLNLPSCNGFQRKLIFQTLRQRFQSGIHLESKTKEKKDRYIVVTRIKTEEDMKQKEANKQAAELAELDAAVGFTKVMKLISESGKLMVGHNMFLDLVHMLHQFYFPLPKSYEEFKSMTKCAFPKIADTKLMAGTSPCKERIPSSVLGDLQKHLTVLPFQKPEVVFPENFPEYKMDDSNLHEAAYDAYITGICFIGMSNFLGSLKDPPLSHVPSSSTLIQPFINKLFLMRVVDIPYLNLAADDVIPNRDHVFHVTFPKEWKAPDLYHLFSPFGNINIFWLDDTSAFISLYKKEKASQVLTALCKRGCPYKIMTYNMFKNGPSSSTFLESRKRSFPADQPEEPPKKKKSLNVDAPPFVSRSRSITPPTPEENGQADETPLPDSTSGKNVEEKMFEEPSW